MIFLTDEEQIEVQEDVEKKKSRKKKKKKKKKNSFQKDDNNNGITIIYPLTLGADYIGAFSTRG